MELFNEDQYKMKVTACDRELIARETEEFLKNGGEIKQIASNISSSVNELSIKERSDMFKRAKSPGSSRGGAKK